MGIYADRVSGLVDADGYCWGPPGDHCDHPHPSGAKYKAGPPTEVAAYIAARAAVQAAANAIQEVEFARHRVEFEARRSRPLSKEAACGCFDLGCERCYPGQERADFIHEQAEIERDRRQS